MSRKIGFWSVFALVTGSQIGSSVFMAPANLAGYGTFAIWGYILAAVGAMSLSYVFATLCSHYPTTGGPHVYVNNLFGRVPAFFTGWTYWVISWVSTTAVIVTAVGYLAPLLGITDKGTLLALQLGLLGVITLINLQGVKMAGNVEFFLTLLKFVPLIIIPVLGLMAFKADHFVALPEVTRDLPLSSLLGQVTLLTLWGFIGLECATTPAGSVENPSKTIPRAIVLGTLSVAILYILNCVGVMGLVHPGMLKVSQAPYVDAAQILFSGNWHLGIAVIASVVCIGTLNAWILASGQIALGLAQDGFLPHFFAKLNKKDAPQWSILISSLGIAPLLVMTVEDNFADQIRVIIDISVTAFLFVYLMCCGGYLKLLKNAQSLMKVFVGLVAAGFCLWVVYETPVDVLLKASVFTLLGLPLFLFWYLPKEKRGTKALA